jgi:hypothetical protein
MFEAFLTVGICSLAIAYLVWFLPRLVRRQRKIRVGTLKRQPMVLRLIVGGAGVAGLICIIIANTNHLSTY